MKTYRTLCIAIYVSATLLFSSCNKMDTTQTSSVATDSVTVPPETAVNVKTTYAEINGRKIAYRSLGKGTPLILCNRFRGILDSWDPAFLDAVAKDFTVIIFDYSGF